MSAPFLMLPEINTEKSDHLCLHSLKDKKLYRVMNGLEEVKDLKCVGSCQEWLAFLDENGDPFLYNPFSRLPIYLPSTHTLPLANDSSLWPQVEKVVMIRKIPGHDSNYCVVVICNYSFGTKIAFCRGGLDEEWRDLEDQGHDTYYDVACCDETKTVFALGPGPSVESWDLKESTPTRMILIQDCYPRTLIKAHSTYSHSLYTWRSYLAVSFGEIFLAVRYIGEYVTSNGEVVHKMDTHYNMVCPYRTMGFHVFKLGRNEWIKVESLGDLAMFVGGNESVMVSTSEHTELKGNAIYFTDDYWDRMDDDFVDYGGHDMGIFKLGDGRIQPLLDFQLQKIAPPPFGL